MFNETLKEEMEDFYFYLQKIVRVDDLNLSKNCDLVLDIMPNENNEIQWSYYYACHDTRCLFWLDDYDAKFMTSELDGVESPAHLSASHHSAICALFSLIRCAEHRLEDLYWYMSCLLLG
jgi:hypothetical protein